MSPEFDSRGSAGITITRPLTPIRPRAETHQFASRSSFKTPTFRNFDRPTTPRSFQHQPNFRPESRRVKLDSPWLSPHAKPRNPFASLEAAINRQAAARVTREREEVAQAVKSQEIQVPKSVSLDGRREKVVKQIEDFLAKPKPQTDRLAVVLAGVQVKVLEETGIKDRAAKAAKAGENPHTLVTEKPQIMVVNKAKLANSDKVVLEIAQRSLKNIEYKKYSDETGLRVATLEQAVAALTTGETALVQQKFKELKLITGNSEQAAQLLRQATKNKVQSPAVLEQNWLVKEMLAQGNLSEPERIRLLIIARKEVRQEEVVAQIDEDVMADRLNNLEKSSIDLIKEKGEATGAELIAQMGSEKEKEKSKPVRIQARIDGGDGKARTEVASLSKRKIGRLYVAARAIFLAHPAIEYVTRITTRKATDQEEHEVLDQSRADIWRFALQRGLAMLSKLIPA